MGLCYKFPKKKVDNLWRPLVNGLLSLPLGWCGTADLACPAVISPGTRWMTYSLWEMCEPVGGEKRARWDKKTACTKEDKRGKRCSGWPVGVQSHESSLANTQKITEKPRQHWTPEKWMHFSSPQTSHCSHNYYLSRADNELGWCSSIFHFKMSGSNLSVLLRVLNDFLGCCQVWSSANSGIFHWLNS